MDNIYHTNTVLNELLSRFPENIIQMFLNSYKRFSISDEVMISTIQEAIQEENGNTGAVTHITWSSKILNGNVYRTLTLNKHYILKQNISLPEQAMRLQYIEEEIIPRLESIKSTVDYKMWKTVWLTAYRLVELTEKNRDNMWEYYMNRYSTIVPNTEELTIWNRKKKIKLLIES
jgi:hypothetical protein